MKNRFELFRPCAYFNSRDPRRVLSSITRLLNVLIYLIHQLCIPLAILIGRRPSSENHSSSTVSTIARKQPKEVVHHRLPESHYRFVLEGLFSLGSFVGTCCSPFRSHDNINNINVSAEIFPIRTVLDSRARLTIVSR